MLAERFWLALGLSALLHLLVLQLPMSAAHRDSAGSTRATDAMDVRLAARPSRTAPPSPALAAEMLQPSLQQEEYPPRGGIPLPTHYFKSDEVDRRAEPVDLAPLIYPQSAFLQRIRGTITLRVFINELGGIDAIDVTKAEPAGIFEQAAIDAVMNTRFSPAELFGRPVKNVKTLEVRFDPEADRP